MLAGCDYWVPDPGFIVEFDESQHFTSPRKRALSVYADTAPLGFLRRALDGALPASRCERTTIPGTATNNERGTTRYGTSSRQSWACSQQCGSTPVIGSGARLIPTAGRDRKRFSDVIHKGRVPFSRTTVESRSPVARPESTLRAAMVFSPSRAEVLGRCSAQRRRGAAAGCADCRFIRRRGHRLRAFFPKATYPRPTRKRTESLKKLASDLGAPLLVGAIDRSVDATGRAWQVLLRFDPDGSRSRVYAKTLHRRRCGLRAGGLGVAVHAPDL